MYTGETLEGRTNRKSASRSLFAIREHSCTVHRAFATCHRNHDCSGMTHYMIRHNLQRFVQYAHQKVAKIPRPACVHLHTQYDLHIKPSETYTQITSTFLLPLPSTRPILKTDQDDTVSESQISSHPPTTSDSETKTQKGNPENLLPHPSSSI